MVLCPHVLRGAARDNILKGVEGTLSWELKTQNEKRETNLIDIKVKLDWDGQEWTPLQFACSLFMINDCNTLDAVRKLLEYNADVNITDDQMQTALHLILRHSSQTDVCDAIACLLLDHGANPDCKDSTRRSPLYLATKHVRYQTVRKLVDEHKVSIFDQVGIFPFRFILLHTSD